MLALAASAHGLCPACLLSTALAAPMSEDPDAGSGPAGDDGLASVPYQIVTLLDRDARSVTYLAHPLGTSRHVALRITAPRDDVADVVSRFRQWRGALAHERHPGLSRLLDVGPAGDGSLYLASDYIAGASLTTLLQRGALAEHERSTIGSQLVEVVESAHARGLAHLDLSAARVKVASASCNDSRIRRAAGARRRRPRAGSRRRCARSALARAGAPASGTDLRVSGRDPSRADGARSEERLGTAPTMTSIVRK
jgi:hypothetical protein